MRQAGPQSLTHHLRYRLCVYAVRQCAVASRMTPRSASCRFSTAHSRDKLPYAMSPGCTPGCAGLATAAGLAQGTNLRPLLPRTSTRRRPPRLAGSVAGADSHRGRPRGPGSSAPPSRGRRVAHAALPVPPPRWGTAVLCVGGTRPTDAGTYADRRDLRITANTNR